MFLKGLMAVFGDRHFFKGPVPGNFPLVDLPGKKVVFLDEWRFNESIFSWATQCLWYDGSSVPVARPQNDAGGLGHKDYTASAPIVVTTKRSALLELQAWALDRADTGTPCAANMAMLCRRLQVYHFTKRTPKPPAALRTCRRCFAELLRTSPTTPFGPRTPPTEAPGGGGDRLPLETRAQPLFSCLLAHNARTGDHAMRRPG